MTRFFPTPGIAVVASVFIGFFAPSTLAATVNPLQSNASFQPESFVRKPELTAPGVIQANSSTSGNPPVNGGPGNTQGSGTR